MKVVLCISDSVALPRIGVNYKDTWHYMLQSNVNDRVFVSRFIRGGTTKMLVDVQEYLHDYMPNEIIIQLGICDCAPRYIRTTSIISKLLHYHLPSWLSSFCWKIIKIKSRDPQITDVSLEDFKKNLECYINEAEKIGVERIIIIKIIKPYESLILQNPHFEGNMSKYNEIIQNLKDKHKIITILNPLNKGFKEHYIEDGYHPARDGNLLVYKEIMAKYILGGN